MVSRQRIVQGDAIDFMQQSEHLYDVIVTSPPYNRGIAYDGYSDNLSPDAYLTWIEDVARAMALCLKPDGSVFINVGSSPTDPWKAIDVARRFGRVFTLQNTFIWVKSISIDRKDDVQSFGHFRPINSTRFVNDCFEYVFHFSFTGNAALDRETVSVPYQDASNAMRWRRGGSGRRCRGNTWYVPYETTQRERAHPASFPVALVKRCVQLHRGCVRVLDPFVGSGATAVACQQLAIDMDGVDLSQSYVDMAIARLEQSHT